MLHRPDLREALRYVFEEQIPFGRALNLKIPPAARFLLRKPDAHGRFGDAAVIVMDQPGKERAERSVRAFGGDLAAGSRELGHCQ